MEWVLNEMAKPLIRRVGSLLGGALLGAGIAGDTVNVIVAGAVAAITVALDLLASHKNRRA